MTEAPLVLGKRPAHPAKWQLEIERQIKELEVKELKMLEWMARYREENRIEFFDKPPNPGPNLKQAQILEAWLDPRYKTFGMSGGERLGKTTLLTIIGISTVIGHFPWNNQDLLFLCNHKKPRKVRYVGQGWNDHVKAVVIPALQTWWPKRRKVTCKGNGIISDTFWKDDKTGGTFEIMSNNQDPKEHKGWEGDLILYDEPCKRDIYTSNARGLVDRRGRELFAATLLNEPWIDREIVKRRLPDGRPDPSVFWVVGTTYDNVGFGITEDGVEEYKSKLSAEEAKSRIFGIPEYMSGLVLPQFKRRTHLVDRFKVPLDWIIDVAMDVHPRENQAALFIATDPRNERYLVEEIWEHGDGTWLGEEVVRCIAQKHYRAGRFIIDPLAKGDSNNQNTTFDKVAKVLYANGYTLETATKDKTSGVLEIKNHLMGPNNRPSLFIFNDLVRTIYEIEGWMYDEKTQKFLDKDDHMCENLYRLLLLNTQWYPKEWEDGDEMDTKVDSGRSKYGGY